MKELSLPFSLFDFFAVLLPGAMGLFGVYLVANPSLSEAGHYAVFSKVVPGLINNELVLVTAFVLLSYLIGQVLNALSEIVIDRPINKYLGAHIVKDLNHHNVKNAVKKMFGEDVLRQSIRRTFIMVESIVGKNLPDAAATAKRFIAMAVMFQSLALSLIVIMVALIRGYLIGSALSSSLLALVLIIASLLIVDLLLLWSYRRYKRMWSQTMCMSFVAFVNPFGSILEEEE